ncbi:FG-GAP repeat domain-containing protein [Vibrio algarum]|uniref:VCBS repeat-containing protein n=1 Tax=Vibrio algarum TaxID=3020714 RepID=A0ABT4YPJ0_9VIBR|nr:VCBS repeat-containing protein [Vibrio sp. KJ40-1]MDB1123477.1 VCBS repeat-containing protein [Vibrio sp. KJ40-1]
MRLLKQFSYFRNINMSDHCRYWLLYGLMLLCMFFVSNTAQATALQKSITSPDHPLVVESEIIKFLTDNFVQLPEKLITINNNATVYAQYAQPTTRYRHGILGDSIEAEQLVVVRDRIAYTHTVSDKYVFEDIKPRLFDVDNDGELEIITVRTHVTKGAGIMIYKIIDNVLAEFAWVEEIGLANRWLNIVASYDLDSDGTVELAWIQTPHIGGVLKVANIKAGKLEVLSELSGYSNHSIGERNLCLSMVTKTKNTIVFYVPTQDRRQIAGFSFSDNTIQKIENINQPTNFSYPLASQYDFTDVVLEGGFCTGL